MGRKKKKCQPVNGFVSRWEEEERATCKWVCFVDGKNRSIDGKKKCQPINGFVYRWEEEERAVDG